MRDFEIASRLLRQIIAEVPVLPAPRTQALALRSLFERAGFEEIAMRSIDVTVTFADFEDVWLAVKDTCAPGLALHHLRAVLRPGHKTECQASAAFTRSGVNGVCRRRLPVSSATALATAGATSGVAIWPAPVG